MRPRIIPQFATHNALTVATVAELAGNTENFEFQRLHGMGEALYERLLQENSGFACRTYAPVGGHQDLLAYLVRRLLENGANSSFVSVSGDPDVPVSELLVPPADIIGTPGAARHRRIPLPADLFGPSRKNSAGVELGDAASLEALLAEIGRATAKPFPEASAVIDGKPVAGNRRELRSPIDARPIGHVVEANEAAAAQAVLAAKAGFPAWNATPARIRAAALRQAAELMEAPPRPDPRSAPGRGRQDARRRHRGTPRGRRLPALLRRRGRSEVRGADRPARPDRRGEPPRCCAAAGPSSASRPWNFPLAIFVGQVAAALVTGNSVRRQAGASRPR